MSLDTTDLRAYWQILARRRWLIAFVVGASGLFALVGSFLITPLYKATATLQIDRQSPDILDVRDISRPDFSWSSWDQFFETQYRILASAPVVRRAAERLDLAANPAYSAAQKGPGLTARLLALLPRRRAPENKADPLEASARGIQAGLEIAPVRDSSLVEISWTHHDRQLAADVANAVADAYIQFSLESRYSTTDQAEEFLVDQSGALKKQISVLELRLQEYAEAKKIFSVRDSNDLALQALTDLSKQRTAAQGELARLEAVGLAAQTASSDSLPEVLNSALIGKLRAEYAALEADCSEQAQRFKEDWPGLLTLRSKLEQAHGRLELETARIAEQVRAGAQAATTRAREEVASLNRLFARHEQQAQLLRRDAIEYEHLEREVRKKRETLDALMHRENEMALSTRLKDLDSTSSNIRVIERASPPRAPFSPNTARNVLLGLLLGLGLGTGLAFLLEHLDNTVGTAGDIEALVTLPLLAIIPHYAVGATAKTRMVRRRPVEAALTVDLVAHRDGRSVVAEAYRALRTSILLSNPGRPPRRVVVTSALPEEGKTATALNLAVVLAQLGRRVLLVDADLRRPRLHRVFLVENLHGLSTVLSGLAPDPAAAVVATPIENLDFLCSGLVPPNPSELLNSSLFARTIDQLIDHGYDHVVIDTPPVLSVSDAVIVAGIADTGVLVVRSGSTPRQALRQAGQRLAPAGGASFGVVLNGYDPESRGEAGYSYYPAKDAEPTAGPEGPSHSRRASGSA